MDNGKTIVLMDMANSIIMKELFIKDNGSMISKKEMDKNIGLMVLFLKGISKKDSKYMENLTGRIIPTIKEN